MKRYVALLVFAVLTSACATQNLNSTLKEESGLQRELSVNGTIDTSYSRGKEVKIVGHYNGLIEFENRKYYAIQIGDIRTNCGRNHEAILYIPTASDITPIIRESLSSNNQRLGDVDVVFRDTPPPIWPSTDKLKEAFSWNGYPDKIVIYFSRAGSDLTAHYRFGQEQYDVGLVSIRDDLGWECRRKSVYYSMYLLYPFSVVYDVVTFPFQWLLWQVWH